MADVPEGGLPPGLRIDGAVATLSLRRPARLNRLSPADLVEIRRHCDTVNARDEVRVLVFTADTVGQARPVFSAGYDIAGFEGDAHDPRSFEHTVQALADLRPPTLAALNGSVYGGATDLVLACDLRLALPGLAWRMPACAIGLHYYASGLRRYVQSFGPDRARQLFLTAEAVSSEQLQQWGVLMELLAPAQFAPRVAALAQQMAALAPLAAQGTKASLRELAGGAAADTVLRERERRCADSDDFREGRQAMAERRAPVFKGH